MKNFKIIILSFATIFLLNCEQDFTDINVNPNDPEKVITSGLMNSATKELMDATRGSFSSGRMTLPWVQYSAQQNYTEEDRFQFREGTNEAYYTDLYRVAKDFKSIIDLNTNPTTKDKMSVYGDNDNQIATARIMLSYIFSILADTYGSVPYYSYGNQDPDFQALQIEKYVKPMYASQTKIYTDILDELKKASNQINVNKPGILGEVIYNGNASKWKKLANSLRLRIANRVNGVIPTASAHITDAIASGLMTSNNDNASQKYENNTLFPSPMFSSYFIDKRTDFKASNTFVDLLKGELGIFGYDPRLQEMIAPRSASLNVNGISFDYTKSTNLSDYEGMPYGLPSGSTANERSAKVSYWSNKVIKADYSEMIMEYSEVLFLLSEVNGWNDAFYKQGVAASMEKWEVDSVVANTFISSLPAANKSNVLTQKYIALFMQPQEAFSEWRRTGFPTTLIKPGQSYSLASSGTYTFSPLSPATYTLVEMPARLTYPITLQKLNPDGYASGVANLGADGDKLTTKLIWDKN